MTGSERAARAGLVIGCALLTASAVEARPRVTWRPTSLRAGDVAVVSIRGLGDGATATGTVAGRAIALFPRADGVAALVGFDFEAAPGRYPWTIVVTPRSGASRTLRGRIAVSPRRFGVERLALPPEMVELDEASTRRAEAEARELRQLFQRSSGARLWRGDFVPPIEGAGPATGFGARRIINGQPRSAHGGADYAAGRGTPVRAVGAGRIALVGDFFFPGRLVVIDHGLGLYTGYFHLDRSAVETGALVARGQEIGAVGSTGRATGPHLHVLATVGSARIDPAALLRVDRVD